MSMDAGEYFHYLLSQKSLLMSAACTAIVWGFALMYAAMFFKRPRAARWFWAGFFFGPFGVICLLCVARLSKRAAPHYY